MGTTPLAVYCECGECLPVEQHEVGTALTCTCGRRVVVPLLEEFRKHPVLLSAASVERRVRRLVTEGVLPNTDACLACGKAPAFALDIEVQCERYTASSTGGQRFLFLPFFGGLVGLTWHEAEGVEIRGRDTDVPTPVGLCADCWRWCRPPASYWYLLLAALLLVVAGSVGYFHLLSGIGLAVGGLIVLLGARRLSMRIWQSTVKELLRTVPVYGQVLERYPQAVVVVRRGKFEKA